MENVDGFTVERMDGKVLLTFTNIFGEGEVYYLTPEDARRVAEALEQFAGIA